MATGASAAVVTTEAEAGRLGARPIARILAIEAVSGPPANIASVPAIAARKALASADVKLDDIDLIEINEAFAAVPLVTTAVLADGDTLRKDRLRERTNVNGGAIAVGHPTGATALRLVMTLADELRRRGGGLGLATICGGIGEGHAAVIEVDAA
jgi:acetyl-CoA C-acetyltransferase